MLVQTIDLIGRALDYAVGMANGWITYPTDSIEQGEWYHTTPQIAPRGHEHNRIRRDGYRPSKDWVDGGPIIEREGIDVRRYEWEGPSMKVLSWSAQFYGTEKPCEQYGPTPLVAAMRCFVLSKLGKEVEIPQELL